MEQGHNSTKRKQDPQVEQGITTSDGNQQKIAKLSHQPATPSTPASTSRQKQTTPPIKDMSNMDPSSLINMNKALFVEMFEKKRKITYLRRKCEFLHKAKVKSNSSYQCIMKHWIQLCNDLKIMISGISKQDVDAQNSRFNSILESVASFEIPGYNQDMSLNMPDWFCVDVHDDKADCPDEEEAFIDEQEDIPVTELDQSLLEELNKTKSILSDLLSIINQPGLLIGMPTNDNVEILIKENREITSKFLSLKDQVEKYKCKIKELNKDIEYKEKERHQACRELDRIRIDSDGKGGPYKPNTPIEEAPPPPSEEPKEDEHDNDNTVPDEKYEAVLKELEEYKERIREFEKSLDNTNREKELAFSDLLTEKEDRIRTQARCDEAYKLSTEYRLQIQNQLEGFKEKLGTVNQEWIAKFEVYQETNNTSQKELDDLNLQVSQLKEKEAQYNQLERQIEEYSKLCHALQEEIKIRKSQANRSQAMGRQLQKNEDEGERRAFLTKLDALEKQLDERNNELNVFGSSLSVDEKLSKFSIQMEKQRQELKTLQDEKVEYQRIITTLETKIENCNVELENSQVEVESLIGEIEAISNEFEVLQNQNPRLLEQVDKLMATTKKLNQDNLDLGRSKNFLTEEMSAVRMKMATAEDSLSKQSELNFTMQTSLQNKEEEIQLHTKQVEAMRQECLKLSNHLKELQHEKMVMNMKIQSLEKEISAQHADLLEAKKECQKCEETKKKETERKDRLLRGDVGEGPLSQLERFELMDLRKLVKCSVCQDGQKNVIISKCFHMFCKDCIDSNLRARNRKCPTCKRMYGQDDVKSVWVT